jgi:hypothetical protein
MTVHPSVNSEAACLPLPSALGRSALIALLWSVLGVAMALSLPETPVRQDQNTQPRGASTAGLSGPRQSMGAPDSDRPTGY